MPSWKKVVLHGSSGSLAHLKLENLTSQSVLGTDSQGNVVAGSVTGYTLPTATSSVLGGVKVGNTLTISSQVLNARTYVGATAAVIGGGDGLDGTAGYVPAASASDATLFLRGDGTWQTPTNTITRLRQSGGTLAAGDFTFAGSGATTVSYSGGTFTISSTDTNTTYSVGDGGLTEKNFTTALKNKLDGIAASADNYSSWTISDSSTSETIRSGDTLTIRGAGATTTSYDSATNILTVTSTDTNTTYTAGTGLTLSGTQFSVTANTYAAYSHNHDSVYLKIADTGSIIDYIVAAAPGTLDTLNEIAAAIGDDANFSASIASVIAGKADASHTHDYDNYRSWNISDETTGGDIESGDSLTVIGAGATTVTYDPEHKALTIDSTDTDTVTSVGVSGNLSTGNIVLVGAGATSITKSGGTITITSTDTDTNTTYSAGTGLTLSGTTFSVTANTYASASHTHSDATTGAAGFMSATDKSKLDGIAANANNYSLPTATASVLGGIKVGTNLSISSGVLSSTDTVTKVGVPDDLSSGDIEIRGSGATTVTKSGNTITIDSTDNDTDTVTAVGVSGNLSTGNITLVGAGATTITKSGGTITITSTDTDTNTTYSAGTGLTLSGTTFSVTAGTYAAASHTHAISDVTGLQTALDGKAASSHTHDDRYYTETESDARFVLNDFAAQTAATSEDEKSGTWNESSNDSSWGNYKPGNDSTAGYSWNDAPGYVQYNIPSGYTTAYIGQLRWDTGGYFDVHAVMSDGSLVFRGRFLSKNTIENTNHSGNHDGQQIIKVSGLDGMQALRITNQSGRLHLQGIGWSKEVDTDGTQTSETHWDLIYNKPSSFTPSSHTHSDATTGAAGFMSATDKSKLDGIAASANNYSLPTATASVLGGIKVGTNLSISSGVLSSTDTVTKVGVPDDLSSGDIEFRGSGATTITKSGNTITISSTDTDTNTTYSAGTGLTLSGTTFSVTANTYAAASHTHAISDVTGLQTALDAKQAASSAITTSNIGSQSVNYATSAGTAGSVTGKSSISKAAHTAGASDYHLELYADNSGDSSKEVSLRFHQGGVYWAQLRYRSGGFRFTSGADDTLVPVYASTFYGDLSGNATTATTANGVAWTNVSGRPTAVSSFTNDAGYLTSYTDTNTVTSVGVSGDLSTGDVELRGSGATTVTKSGGTITISSTDNNTTYSAGTGLTLSGTTFSVTAGTYAAASHTHDDRYYTETESNQYFGAFGRSTLHSAYSDFNTSPGFGGWSYVIGTTNSGHNGSQGGYRLRVGLGSDYSIDTTSGAYAMELNIPRTSQGGSSTGYLIMRQMENGSWGSWSKISSGYADSAGAVAWTNVSGRPTNVSSFTNDSGYITSYVNTVTSVGVSGDLSTGNITLVGSGATSISKSSGTITISSTDTNTTYSAGTGLTLSGTTFSVTAGTYAAASHTHDDRYYTESEVDSLLSGKVSTDTVKVLGGGISYDTDRSLKVSNGLAIYGAYNGGANTPFTYDIAAQFAFSSRAFELAADWINSDGAKLKLRTLRDCCQNWSPWVSILTSYDFTDWAQQKENQRLSTSNSVTFTSTTSPTILVNDHSDNTKGYRIYNTSGTSVSAMFTNSSNYLVIGAGAFDQINLNKKVLVNGVALGVNVTPSATAGRIDASNDIVAYSSSDRRLKKNIAPIEDAVKKVKALTGVEFDWDPEYKAAHGYEGHDTGVIAQQVQEVMPTAVRTNETGYLAVRYEKLIGLLIEANKELAARVEELEKKLG